MAKLNPPKIVKLSKMQILKNNIKEIKNPFPKSDKPIDINSQDSFGYCYVAFESCRNEILKLFAEVKP